LTAYVRSRTGASVKRSDHQQLRDRLVDRL